jgi:protein-S-isoprenylcysteine O-methyltransferase Ste14
MEEEHSVNGPEPKTTRSPWWRGARGEWWVAAQGALLILVLFGPRTLPGWPAFPLPGGSRILGVALLALGGALALAAMLRLGPGLTPLPYPREGGALVETGPYALVRHPIYGGVLIACIGWGFFVRGWLTLGYALLVLLFLDLKSRREEKWLAEKFPGYPAYQRRVRKLIPFIY